MALRRIPATDPYTEADVIRRVWYVLNATGLGWTGPVSEKGAEDIARKRGLNRVSAGVTYRRDRPGVGMETEEWEVVE